MTDVGRTARSGSADDYCEHAGHEWVDAGGGRFVCAVCGAEEFGELDPYGFDVGASQDELYDRYPDWGWPEAGARE